MQVKAGNIKRQINAMCSKYKVGKAEIEAKLLVYKVVGITAIYYNIEAWSHLRKIDGEELERIQGRVIKEILDLPKSTPYWGIIYELNLMPIRLLILYKKMMLYHGIIH